MKTCPSREQLKQLLDEALAEAEQTSLEEHVQGCGTCQKELDSLANATALLTKDALPGGRGVLSVGDEAFLQRLQQASPPADKPFSAAAPSAAADEHPAVPGYDVLELLGYGGMGVIYKARHIALNRLVALKMIAGRHHSRPEELLRFRIEGELIARLDHPHIVHIYEVGTYAGRPFLALEFINGGSLADHLDGSPQPPRQAAELVEILARGVHAAHLQGIVHRDLKPANILLAAKEDSEGSSGRGRQKTAYGIPMIADFGLAKQLDRNVRLTQTGSVMGTPSYMAPEQCRGASQETGPATDVYALGILLYELLTGRLPFQAAETMDLLHRILEEEPSPPSRLLPALPRDLECISLHCLEKEPRKRYASAEALADDLRRFLNDEPIHARPVGRLERVWKWARRRPSVAALMLAVALVAALGVAGVTGAMFYAFAGWGEADRLAASEGKLRHEAERLSLRLTLEKAWSLPEQGQVAEGMLWLVHCLEVAPADDANLQQAIRANLAAWYGQLHSLRAQLPHRSEMATLAFSPDGRRIATGGIDKTVRIWDTLTGQPVGPPLSHEATVQAVAFHGDGKRLVVATETPLMYLGCDNVEACR
jgi:serine/threonine protein kinase